MAALFLNLVMNNHVQVEPRKVRSRDMVNLAYSDVGQIAEGDIIVLSLEVHGNRVMARISVVIEFDPILDPRSVCSITDYRKGVVLSPHPLAVQPDVNGNNVTVLVGMAVVDVDVLRNGSVRLLNIFLIGSRGQKKQLQQVGVAGLRDERSPKEASRGGEQYNRALHNLSSKRERANRHTIGSRFYSRLAHSWMEGSPAGAAS